MLRSPILIHVIDTDAGHPMPVSLASVVKVSHHPLTPARMFINSLMWVPLGNPCDWRSMDDARSCLGDRSHALAVAGLLEEFIRDPYSAMRENPALRQRLKKVMDTYDHLRGNVETTSWVGALDLPARPSDPAALARLHEEELRAYAKPRWRDPKHWLGKSASDAPTKLCPHKLAPKLVDDLDRFLQQAREVICASPESFSASDLPRAKIAKWGYAHPQKGLSHELLTSHPIAAVNGIALPKGSCTDPHPRGRIHSPVALTLPPIR